MCIYIQRYRESIQNSVSNRRNATITEKFLQFLQCKLFEIVDCKCYLTSFLRDGVGGGHSSNLFELIYFLASQ